MLGDFTPVPQSSDGIRLKKFRTFYLVASLCWFAGVKLIAFDEGDVGIRQDFDLQGSLFEIAIFGLLIFYCVLHRRLLLSHLRQLWRPFPVLLITVLSTLWSVDPALTFRRSIVFLSGTLFAYYIGVTFTPAQLLDLYRKALLFTVFASIVVIVLLPSYGISHGAHGGDWRGAVYHKNRFGELMALALMTLVIAPGERLRGARRWVIAVVTLGLLYKSHSSTAVSSLGVVLLVQGIWPIVRLRRKALIGVLAVGYPLVAVAIGLVISYSASLFLLLGKDRTFSGRDRLWAGIIDAIRVRPLLGYGYLTFWHQQAGGLAVIAERTNFVPPQGHEGYLDVMLHVGMVGLGLFLIYFLGSMWLALREARRTDSPEARWFFSILVFMSILNLTESQILEPFFFLWITLTAFTISSVMARAGRYREVDEETPLVSDRSTLMSAV